MKDVLDACDIVDEQVHDDLSSKDGKKAVNKRSNSQQDVDFDAFAGAHAVPLKEGENKAIDDEEKKETEDNESNQPQKDALSKTTTDKQEEEEEQQQQQQPSAEKTEKNRDKSRFVTPKDFELLKVIGMGSFGKVLQVRNKESKRILAMKVISKRILKRKSNYVENVLAERDILTKIRHPFVVTMHCSFQTREKLFLIMDFLAGGELFLRLGREGIFLEKTAAFYIAEIVLALDHLHTQGILHRDLKPENILLSSDGHVCLTDFGLAKDFSGEGGFQNDDDEARARTVCGTQEYMAPEMVARKGYGRAADYWSLGCISYEMLSGRPPFESKKGAKDLFRKIMMERVKMPDGSSAAACKLLKGLLNRNATARLGAARSTMFEVGGVAGLKAAIFFNGLDWDKLERREIAPPDQKPVDNDEDLRHFYDEFKKMPLPRSVTEMSTEDFHPRRVESHAFRGFSFVQEDFQLPLRPEQEIEDYWNNHDEDGESDSECASSKLDEEMIKSATEEAQPEKKKRPPRKRKKKNALSPTPSDAGDPPAKESEKTPPTVSSKAPQPAPKKEEEEVRENVAPTAPQPVPKPKKKKEEEKWAEVPTNKSKKPVAKTSPKQFGNRGVRTNNNQRTNGRQQPAPSTVQQRQAPPPPPAPSQPYRPAPGSWAAKLHRNEAPLSSGKQQTSAAPQDASRWANRGQATNGSGGWHQQARESPLDAWARERNRPAPTEKRRPPEAERQNSFGPSSDWRQHSMSSRSNSGLRLSSSSMDETRQAWPTLGPQAQSGTTTPKGAWAAKRK